MQVGEHGSCGRSPVKSQAEGLVLPHSAAATPQIKERDAVVQMAATGSYLVRFSLIGPPGPPPGPPSILMFNVISSPFTEPS